VGRNIMSDISKVLKKLSNKYSADFIAKLDREPEPVEVVSTGVRSIDRAVIVGGFPRGRITTLYGPESGGKTTLTLWSIGQLVANGGTGVYIDIEQGGSEQYVFDCIQGSGISVKDAVDSNKLILLRPETAEQAMDALKALIPHVDLAIVDSISAMLTQAEIAAEEGAHLVGVRARFQTGEFTKANRILNTTNCALVVISQERANISPYGSSTTTTEPKALRHLASVRIRVSKDGVALKRDGKPYAQPAKAKINKNKVAAPGGQAGFDIIYGHGVDMVRDTLDTAVAQQVVRSGGGMYYFPPEAEEYLLKVKGMRPAVRYLQDHKDVYVALQEATQIKEVK
jgi:recombination protein RecA